MSHRDCYLVADIGGTNARFAIARGSTTSGFKLDEVRRFKNEHFEHLRDAAHAYLESCEGEKPAAGCLAVAGPVEDGMVRLTNSTWRFKPDELASDLGLSTIVPVNDFAAQARGAPLMPGDGLTQVNPGTADTTAMIAVLGPGTGLGLGLLLNRPNGVLTLPTEGGHGGFAPRTELEVEVGRFIVQEYGFVSWERLLSGRGLVNIHRALCQINGTTWPGHRPEDITAEALQDKTSTSRQTVDLFCAALGGYAGDVAVFTGAKGGVYLGGGILPKISSLFDQSAFLSRFKAHGPMTGYVEDIPVWMITSEAASLLGAAALAEQGGL